MLTGAAAQARRLDNGWIGGEHHLLALLAEPSAASEVLAELGVTHDRAEDYLRRLWANPDIPRYEPSKGLSPNPLAVRLEARAEGLALAWGHRRPTPEHWLLAMVYEDHGPVEVLHHLGAPQQAILEAMRRRGIQVPEVEPPTFRPWRGLHRVEVAKAELQPVIDLLTEQHPPGSEWRWGFNWLPGEPRRAAVVSEEGIDLDAVLAQVRRQDGGSPA